MKPTSTRLLRATLALAILALPCAALQSNTGGAIAGRVTAVRAGTIHRVENGEVIEGGGTILIEGGMIVAVGRDVAIPASARVVDFGTDAVITPGLVAADSTYGGRPSERTADPALMAADAFDFYSPYVFPLSEGITSVYVAPARGRLIAGQGAVFKLAGSDERARVLSESAVIHGAISAEARNTPGYWKPPVPATADVGMGVEDPQLPKSLMGAIVALRELLAIAQGESDSGAYGPDTAAKLRELMVARKPWRMGATTEPEVRALLSFFKENGLPLIIDGAQGAGELARDIAAAGATVIVDAPINPNALGRDFGKERDAQWPDYAVASKLAAAGVPFAIAPPNHVAASELRFAAVVASRGGLDRKIALRAITLAPAEILGVADRVGSLTPGKDADLAVFNGDPLGGASVIETWIGGEVVYKANETAAVVLAVDDLYVGDGEVLSPGEVLLQDGKVRAVGRRVGRPIGATVVRGKAAMPGMIDALGHLGLEGSTKVPATRFELKRIVEPGDSTDRRVARAGVTTVVLAPRGTSRSGAPLMAYKPAGAEVERMVVEDPAALRFQWTDKNRLESGKAVREILVKAVEYKKKWDEYEKKRAAWTPPKEAAAAPATKEGEAKKEGEADKDKKKEGEADKKSDGDADKAEGDKKDEEADKKKPKKKKGEKEPPAPMTGAWETRITVPPFAETRFRLYLNDIDGKVSGSLRCSALSDDLVDVSGQRTERKLSLAGEGTRGRIAVEAEEADDKLKGHVSLGETRVEFEAAHTSTGYEIAGRPERRQPKDDKSKEGKKEVKGEPKAPALDPDLEPLRRAIEGQAAVVVGVEREDEIVECVDAFVAAGIEPVLLGANDAYKVVERIKDRVAGVLLSERIVHTEPKTGIQKRNRYAELSGAGIPVAFHSSAEEGAADLPLMAAYAVAQGMSPEEALRALTTAAAEMYAIEDRVGRIATGLDADVLLLDGSPFEASTSVVRVWVDGREVR